MPIDRLAHLVLVRMHARRMTITQLADIADIHRTDLGRWLAGTRSITVAKALSVMAVLRIRIEGEDDVAPPKGRSRSHGDRPHRR